VKKSSLAEKILAVTILIIMATLLFGQWKIHSINETMIQPTRQQIVIAENIKSKTIKIEGSAPEWQFWWNWGIQFAVALATFLAVLAALREQVWQPRLEISVPKPEGTFAKAELEIKIKNQETGAIEDAKTLTPSRWYHIYLKNPRRRWSRVSNVRVWILKIELFENGKFEKQWDGKMPIHWRDGAVKSNMLFIGADEECDLCSVTLVPNQPPILRIHPVAFIYSMPVIWTGKVRLAALFQAQGIEIDSQIMRVEIDWNGKWAAGDEDMAHNLKIHAKIL
jgi:hypothetical protein